jgi:hypothetical protein
VPTSPVETSVPGTVAATGADRRVHPRLKASELRGLITARVKYGDEVKLIDLSVGGALVESAGKIVRDSSIVFEFAGPGSTLLVPSRALRVSPLSHLDDSGRYEGAFAFKRPLALADLLKEPAAAWQKVVARCRDGRIIQGYTSDFQASKRGLSISPSPFADAAREVTISELDSIFFFRDSALNDTDSKAASQALGRRIAVTLPDGETLVGTTLNYRRDGNGFFVHPEGNPNVVRVFVAPWAIRNLKFL